MKLIIQIPCYNEEKSLPITLKDLPKKVDGFDKVEWLIINDGSQDNTTEVAKAHGVNHVVHFNKNKGLAEVFVAGLEACLSLGADVIVNTDADNQYQASYIEKLTKPILEGKADMVIGARPIHNIRHFSFIKKMLQKFGSWVVRKFSKTTIPDAPSGFRAISREAALKLNVFSSYTYTLETIIQAGRKNLSVLSIPIEVNEDLRPSRLVKNIFSYVKRSILTIFRIFVIYKPFRFFMSIGFILFLTGFALGGRFLFFYFSGKGDGHVQSLILASILLGMGFQTMLTAFLADLIATNRKILEDVQYKIRKIESSKPHE